MACFAAVEPAEVPEPGEDPPRAGFPFGAPACGFVAVGDAKAADDLGDVPLGAVEGDAQTLSDLLVREVAAQEFEHLLLASREGFGCAAGTSGSVHGG